MNDIMTWHATTKGDDRFEWWLYLRNQLKISPQYYTCRQCGMKFDSFGDMQRHILVEHMQKGDIIGKEQSQKSNPNIDVA